jgi:hypothetical protein
MINIRSICTEDIDRLLDIKLRKSDCDEARAALGLDSIDALLFSISESSWTKVIEADGEIIGVFGLVKTNSMGVPWLVGTDKLTKYKRDLMRIPKQVIKDMLKECGVLSNFVDVRNVTTIRWLKRLGFELSIVACPLVDPENLFYQFTMEST